MTKNPTSYCQSTHMRTEMTKFNYRMKYADPTGTHELLFYSVQEMTDYLVSHQGHSVSSAHRIATSTAESKVVIFDNSDDQQNPFDIRIEKEIHNV